MESIRIEAVLPPVKLVLDRYWLPGAKRSISDHVAGFFTKLCADLGVVPVPPQAVTIDAVNAHLLELVEVAEPVVLGSISRASGAGSKGKELVEVL